MLLRSGAGSRYRPTAAAAARRAGRVNFGSDCKEVRRACLLMDYPRERESARDQRAYRLSATWAAMTRCRSTTSRQLAHWQSFQRHWRLCPFRHDTTPWLRQRAHLGVRSSRLDDVLEGPPPSAGRPAAAVDDHSCTPTGTFVYRVGQKTRLLCRCRYFIG